MLSKVVFKCVLLLASLAVTHSQLEDVCVENACTRTRWDGKNVTGVEISKLRRRDGECVTQCINERRGKVLVAVGRAACGTVCSNSTSSIVDECKDREACPRRRRRYQVNYLDRNGECRQICANKRRATMVVGTRGGSCGSCDPAT